MILPILLVFSHRAQVYPPGAPTILCMESSVDRSSFLAHPHHLHRPRHSSLAKIVHLSLNDFTSPRTTWRAQDRNHRKAVDCGPERVR